MQTSSSSKMDLSALEILFDIRIFSLKWRDLISAVNNMINTDSTKTESEAVAVLITIDSQQQKAISKLWLFLYAFIQYQYLKFRISRLAGVTMNSYGVYPSIHRPFVIYQLNTTAETYANSNILPKVKHGLKGLIPGVLKFITQYHTSTAGIVILVYKK